MCFSISSLWWNPGERRERRGPVAVKMQPRPDADRASAQSRRRDGGDGLERRPLASSPGGSRHARERETRADDWASSQRECRAIFMTSGVCRRTRSWGFLPLGPVLPVGARLTRRLREEPPPGELARMYFDRNATMSGATRRGQPGWIGGRAPTGRTGPRGFHHRLFGRDASPLEPPPGELGRLGFTTGCQPRPGQ